MADGGRYRGSREHGADYFDDVMGDNRAPEIFRTDMGGIGEYDDVKEHATEEGIVIVMHCRPPGCGKPRQVTLTWGELFVVAHAPQTNILPSGWRISEVNHAPCPSLPCNCGRQIEPIVPVDWAWKQVNLALQGGFTSQQALMGDPEVRRVQAIMQQGQAPMMQQAGMPGGWQR